MKGFEIIESSITSLLDQNEQGVFIGVPHTDMNFHDYLGRTILKNPQFTHFFVEISDHVFKQHCAVLKLGLESAVLSKEEKEKLFFTVSQNQPIVFPALCAHFLYNIQVKGMDVSQAELDSIMPAFFGTSTQKEALQALEKRQEHNQHMIDTIFSTKASVANMKYIILAGPMHGEIPTALGIKNMMIMEKTFHEAVDKVLSIDTPVNQRIRTLRDSIMVDYTFLYTQHGKKISVQEVAPKLKQETKAKVETKEIAASTNTEATKKSDNERSLRAAAMNGDETALQSFIDKGVDVNSKGEKSQKTALHLAAGNDRLGCVKILLAAGAKQTKDSLGSFPLDDAVSAEMRTALTGKVVPSKLPSHRVKA